MSTAPLPPPPVYIFREHKSSVNYVHIFDQDELMASCDGDGWIVVWKMKTRRPIVKWKAHEDSCLKVTSIKNNELISQGRDNMIHIWELPNEQQNEPTRISSIVYNALGFCKLACDVKDTESTLLCFPSKDEINTFDIYDLTHQRYMLQDIGKADASRLRLGSCMAVELFRTSDALFVLAGYESGILVLWEIKENQVKIIWHRQEHKEPILDLAVDHTKSFVISSSADNQLCKYSVATGDIIKKITIKKSGIVRLAIRPDNKIFATGGYDGNIRVFSVKSMKPLAVLKCHKDSVYGIEFGSNNKWLLASSQDYRISSWIIYE